MARVRKGDIVTVKRGRSMKTAMRPDRPEGDLAGTRCMVLDDPVERRSGMTDRATERVHVVPIESRDDPTGMFDIPTDYLRRPSGLSFAAAGEAVDRAVRRIFHKKTIYHSDGTTTEVEREF